MLSGLSLPHLLVLLVIIILIFGTKKLRNIGGDLGGTIREFKKALGSDADNKNEPPSNPPAANKDDAQTTDQPKSS